METTIIPLAGDNIVYLYAELQAYVIIVIRELVKRKNINVHIVYWDKNKLTPYVPPPIDKVYYYERSNFNDIKKLYQLVKMLKPSMIYVSGWMDKTYMVVCKKIRKTLSIPIVAASDSQWHGGKQWFNVIISPFFHKKCFSHLQISGIWQYEYARHLGFSPQQILTHNYSADVNIFHKVDIERKKIDFPKRILYIGRFAPVKGLKYLVDAWDSIIDKKLWVLTLIGNGPEKEYLIKNKDIEVLEFMQQEELIQYIQNSGCFILPSIKEPWAVVLHEAAAGGLPILASNICGAVPYFVVNNYNGFTFSPGNSVEIKIALEKVINTSEERLIEMSYNSRKLSERITPEIVVSTMLSAMQEA
jgi:glycosyltransferase involved in cell wall biosynthesis